MASLTSSPGKDASSTINILLALPFALNGTSKDAIIRSLAAAAELAIDQVNNRTYILPNTHVNVIRVNTWDPAANSVWKASNSGGYAVAAIADAMASMPGEERKKPRRDTMFTGEAATYYTKPFCGASQDSTSLSDKNNYPYFFRTQFAKGEAAYVLRLLKEWRVTRVASYDLHYIFVAAAADIVGSFDTYAIDNGMVSSSYVYLSYNPPFKDVSAVNSSMGWMFEGFQLLYGAVARTSSPVYQAFNNTWSKLNMQYATNYMISGGAPEEYAPQAYDCAMVMLNGFDQLLKKSPSCMPSMLSDGSLADRLNFTAFMNTGYAGLSWNPLTLNQYGDLAIPYLFYTLNETNWADFNIFDATYAFAETSMEDPIGLPKLFNLSPMRPQDDLLSRARTRRPTMISPAQALSRKSTRDSFRAGATAKIYPSDYTKHSTGGPAIPAPSLSNWSSRETLLAKAGTQSQQLEEHRKRADVEAGLSTKLHLMITTARDEVRILVRDPSQYDALQAVLHAVAAENEKTHMI
ncbi:hypothetical protein HK101_003380, partial [Irineochytrium annulatum]